MSTRWLFLDMNAFFASVEQQEEPRLRGRPIIVAPVLADTTCAIAASYEAKAYGIRTGMQVREAKRLCPGLEVVPSQTASYRSYHQRLVSLLDDRFATVKVLSVDEMACRLSPLLRESESATGARLKREIQERLGDCMKCSVGIAPNIFLAKVATEVEKPDGLTVWQQADLPHALHALDLRDIPGIGPRMRTRLSRQGVTTMRQVCEASQEELHRWMGSVVGKRMWLMLRGSRDADYGMEQETPRKTVGHSHVLAPEMRSREGVEKVLFRLLSKALRRLRAYDLFARSLNLYIAYTSPNDRELGRDHWHQHSAGHDPADDDLTWFRIARSMMRAIPDKPGYVPLMAGVTFMDLVRRQDVNLALFDRAATRSKLARTIDALNARFNYTVDLGSVFWNHKHAPDRISFGTSLLPRNYDGDEDDWIEGMTVRQVVECVSR